MKLELTLMMDSATFAGEDAGYEVERILRATAMRFHAVHADDLKGMEFPITDVTGQVVGAVSIIDA